MENLLLFLTLLIPLYTVIGIVVSINVIFNSFEYKQPFRRGDLVLSIFFLPVVLFSGIAMLGVSFIISIFKKESKFKKWWNKPVRRK